MPETFTVLGARGFVGRALVRHLRERDHTVLTPMRDDETLFRRPLGHVIYAIGLTSDFRERPFETMDAHVAVLSDVLRRIRFESFLYLSSTRVYGAAGGNSESERLQVDPANPGDLYNLSKLAGEALCHASGREGVRVARLSNVYATAFDDHKESGDFLPSLLRAAVAGRILLRTSLNSAKDYVRIDDVCRALERIATRGTQRCYNIASGHNTRNEEIADSLRRTIGCAVDVVADAPEVMFSPIDISRLAAEFAAAGEAWSPSRLTDDLPHLLASRQRPSAA